MKSVRFNGGALLVCVALLALVRCSGYAPRITAAPPAPANISPNAAIQDLVYLSDPKSNQVMVYGYPKGKLVAKLSNFGAPRGECADAKGNVWIVDTQALQIDEYPHGAAKPIVALSTPGEPWGCSVNPLSGDIAVAGGSKNAVIFIFHHSVKQRWRDAEVYTDKTMLTGAFCGYDAHGNLFVDGRTKNGTFALAELPHRSSTLIDLLVGSKINAPGQVQWDGKYLAVGDPGTAPSVVYDFLVYGSSLSEVRKITLQKTKSVRQFWIDGNRIIGPDFDARVGVWAYPAGGSMLYSYSVPGFGATVSKAQ
jgi:hypothetical protein